MSKVLVIIDMQNDFITGSLANPDAEKIIPGICDLIRDWYGPVVLTRDTHTSDYLDTEEGQHLPIKHCIYETHGWQLHSDINRAIEEREKPYFLYNKDRFGYKYWGDWSGYDEFYLCGTCTDICVLANAIELKTHCPKSKVFVYANLCAGTSKEAHDAALLCMKNCHINIIK